MERIPWEERNFLPLPGEIITFWQIASLRGNWQKARRARFLLMYAAGRPKEQILAELRVSERSLARWWTRWVEGGVLGLLYLGDTSLDRWLPYVDPALASRIRAAVWQVRGLVLADLGHALEGLRPICAACPKVRAIAGAEICPCGECLNATSAI